MLEWPDSTVLYVSLSTKNKEMRKEANIIGVRRIRVNEDSVAGEGGLVVVLAGVVDIFEPDYV